MTAALDAPVRAFRERLLRETVNWCMTRSPWYGERFSPAVAQGFYGLDDLPRLPVLFRDEAVENADQILCRHEQPACVQYTTGTTGNLFHLYRSHSEVDFISAFYSQLAAAAHAKDTTRPLWLSLTSAYHGTPTPVPGWPFIVSAGVHDRTQARQAYALLAKEFAFPGVESRISGIAGGDILLKALTAYLMDEEIDPGSFGIRQIAVTGGFMSPALKKLLAEVWGATLTDRYSISEVYGGASQSGPGGPWVFDTEIIPEVLHPRTLQPVRRGLGVLVLTGLYPFMQMMPMVRYHTGDLVEIVAPQRDEEGDLAVRFVGRERRSIVDTSGTDVRPLLLSGPLLEIVESFPDVAKTARFRDLCSGDGLELAGKVHLSVDSRTDSAGAPRSITLTLGMRYAPWMFPERATAVQTRIRHQLYDRFPALRARVHDGLTRLDVVLAPASKVAAYNAK